MPLRMNIHRLLIRLRGPRFAGRDEGWTFIEAALSVLLITVVFLGFTVALLAFREMFNRAWATRIMDQYASDFSAELRKRLRSASSIALDPAQYGLGSCRIIVPIYDFRSTMGNVVFGDTTYHFSVHPTEGIRIGLNNTPPQQYDWEFTHPDWKQKHIFHVTLFNYYPGAYMEPGRQPYFYESMAKIRFRIRYERPRKVEAPQGLTSMEYVLEKDYTVSGFMKNHIDQPD